MTLIQRRNNVVCPVGMASEHPWGGLPAFQTPNNRKIYVVVPVLPLKAAVFSSPLQTALSLGKQNETVSNR